MKKKESKFTPDFGTAARNIDQDFEPTELQNPVPWALVAIAVVLAIWGAFTLYLDAQATDDGEAAQSDRTAVEAGTAPADSTPDEVKLARGDLTAAQGAALFGTYCATCHQANGSGVRGAIPPIDGSRYVMADAEVPISILLRGISGPIEVKNQIYNGRMPTFHGVLSDDEIALVLTHVRSAWSNKAERIDPAQVATVRQTLGSDLARPWASGAELEDAFGITDRTESARPADPETTQQVQREERNAEAE